MTPQFRIFLAVVLLAICGAYALAQPVTAPLEPCITDRPDLPLPMVTKPLGTPLQMQGQCGPAIVEANAIGAAAAWWCPRPAPLPPVLVPYAVRWSDLTPAMLADYALLGLPGDNAARMAAMQAKYQTSHFLDMCDVWGPARERINAAMPPTLTVPTTVYRTPAAGTFTLYTVSAGKLSGIVSGRKATANALCNCNAAKVVSGTSTYCTLDAGPATEATLCKAVQ
jgi:hypothetical protein